MPDQSLGFWFAVLCGCVVLLVRATRRAAKLYAVPVNQDIRECTFDDPALPQLFATFVNELSAALEGLGFEYRTCMTCALIPGRNEPLFAVYVNPTRRVYSLILWAGRKINSAVQPRITGVDFITEFADGYRLTTSNTKIGPAVDRTANGATYWFVEVDDVRRLFDLHERLCKQRQASRMAVVHDVDLTSWMLAGRQQSFDAYVAMHLWRRTADGLTYIPRLLWILKAMSLSLPGVAQLRRWYARGAMRRRAVQLLGGAATID